MIRQEALDALEKGSPVIVGGESFTSIKALNEKHPHLFDDSIPAPPVKKGGSTDLATEIVSRLINHFEGGTKPASEDEVTLSKAHVGEIQEHIKSLETENADLKAKLPGDDRIIVKKSDADDARDRIEELEKQNAALKAEVEKLKKAKPASTEPPAASGSTPVPASTPAST